MAQASSLLPWIWTYEALLSDGELDPSLIWDLIEKAPQLLDHLGRNMIENVALICLESLFVAGYAKDDSPFLFLDSTTKFAPTESCEHVLRFVFGKIPSLKFTGDEQSTMDIHSFIAHKRTSMPECTIQQLKASILEGTIKCLAACKDTSVVAFRKQGETVLSGDDHSNAAPYTHSAVQINGEMEKPIELDTEMVGVDVPNHGFQPNASVNASRDESRGDVIANEPSDNTDDIRQTEEVTGGTDGDGRGNARIDDDLTKSEFHSAISEHVKDKKNESFARKMLALFLSSNVEEHGPNVHIGARQAKDEDHEVVLNEHLDETRGKQTTVPEDHNDVDNNHVHQCIDEDLEESHEPPAERENGKGASSSTSGKGRILKTYPYPAHHQTLRARRPFTLAEENMLKLGVAKFSKLGKNYTPWKLILKYGADVFMKGRSAVDLKDKWRNMMSKGNTNL